jgi:hypothetical protein
MNVVVARSPEGVQQLFSVRLWQAQQRCAPYLTPQMSMEMGGSKHFETARGYATTLVLGGDRFHLRIAEKFLRADLNRQDAILRHEIGHIVDFSVPPHVLAGWCPELSATPERKADEIATWLWGDPIFYDTEDVQSLRPGITPRPERLGL